MCGIVGIFNWSGEVVPDATVIAMRDRMSRRGPDDAGLFTHRDRDLFVGLGHRRLSIIDLSPSGRQPMATADGSLWIVFNGEIFNYRELRNELLETGRYAFRSQTDTEVILYGVREWGLDGCLARLRGMYAFALFDAMEKSLTLVRDPLGVKPLYYSRRPGSLIFASEIKAILAHPDSKPAIDDEALFHYLTFASAPAPRTLFEGIAKLDHGTYLRVDCRGRLGQRRFWDPARFAPHDPAIPERDYMDELRRLLRQAVARRMVSDVPFGAFLSGGVDSSLNVALMAELLDRPVETYSIDIQDDPSNEFAHARFIAQRFGANHHEIVIDDRDFIEFLPRMAYHQDEPLADPVCVPLYYLAKLARESGTPVVQVGEGSDELFAGYSMYHAFARWERAAYRPYLRLPRPLRRLAHAILEGFLPAEYADALRRAADEEPLFLGNAVAFWDCEKRGLLKPERLMPRSSGRLIGDLASPFQDRESRDRILALELRNRLPELLLMRVDKMSMACSVEARVPFLDEDVVEFALRIPAALKFRDGEAKYLLKQAARGIIPDEVIYRSKRGFCGSATTMLSDAVTRFARERILGSPLVAERFNRPFIERLFDRHRRRKRFNSFKIWNLLNLVLWHACWFEETPRDSAAREPGPSF